MPTANTANTPPASSLSTLPLREPSPLWSYLLAIALACSFVVYLFPLSFLAGHSTVFDFGDNAQHVSGWWYYAQDNWHFPFLHTTRVDHPEGLNIAFTDSIPLSALFFKTLMTWFPSWFPEHFHYFGIWVGLVFVTQAVATTLLMRALGAKSVFALLISVGFALTWPVIHVRYSHAALMMQSLILFALAFYFLGRHQLWCSKHVAAAFIVLNVVALTVHPYFLPFTAGLFVAFMVEQILKSERWTTQILRLLAFAIALGAVGWLLGYFGHNTYRGGYGEHFNFNLASPFCGNSKLIPCEYGAVPITRFEGFNYFGAGLILLLPFALVLNWRSMVTLPKRYPALMGVLLGCFLYAVSNHVWLGNMELLSFPVPTWLQWLTGTYRAAGRFFWIIGYVILFGTLVALLKRRSWPVVFLLVFALALQIKDVKPWLSHIQTEAAKPSTLNYADWAPVMAQVDKLVIYPTFDCGPGNLQYYTWIMQLAGYYGKLLNSGYTSRDDKDCKASEVDIQTPFKPRHLYTISSETYYNAPFTSEFTFPAPFQQAMERGECVRRPDGMLCLPGSTPDFWQSQQLKTNPIKIIAQGRQWAGAELSTNIGQTMGKGFEQRLVPKKAKEPGWLSFGPFVALSPGRYHFAIDYTSNAAPDQQTGNWDVVVQMGGAANEKRLFAGKLAGTEGQVKRIEDVLIIDASTTGKPLEIRTYFLAQGDLQLVSILLQKTP
jgi:Family of unknown function (DUF6311)